ncbi:MAG TPA: transcriptional regulator [Actinobacteria bacterium]|nr:transcriptional regulator [Actinomycetota bacterium]
MDNLASYNSDLSNIQNRLRRIEGQVRGLQRLVAEGSYCVDILTQISSVSRALEKVALIILEDHIKGCVRDSITEQNSEQSIDELLNVLERFLKT